MLAESRHRVRVPRAISWAVAGDILSDVVPTTLFWFLDGRRFPPGHCRSCGYNLTGSVSGVCPERGGKV